MSNRQAPKHFSVNSQSLVWNIELKKLLTKTTEWKFSLEFAKISKTSSQHCSECEDRHLKNISAPVHAGNHMNVSTK